MATRLSPSGTAIKSQFSLSSSSKKSNLKSPLCGNNSGEYTWYQLSNLTYTQDILSDALYALQINIIPGMWKFVIFLYWTAFVEWMNTLLTAIFWSLADTCYEAKMLHDSTHIAFAEELEQERCCTNSRVFRSNSWDSRFRHLNINSWSQ